MFLPGRGLVLRCNYRAHAGMMIGPQTALAQGKLQHIPKILSHRMPFPKAGSPAGAAKTSPATGRTRAFAGHCSVLMADMFSDGRSGEGPLAPQQDK